MNEERLEVYPSESERRKSTSTLHRKLTLTFTDRMLFQQQKNPQRQTVPLDKKRSSLITQKTAAMDREFLVRKKDKIVCKYIHSAG